MNTNIKIIIIIF